MRRHSLLTAVLIVAPLQVSAADFTFNVPVEVNDLHPTVTTMEVSCLVKAEVGGDILGQGERVITLTDGGYSGTVTVEVDVEEGAAGSTRHPSNVTLYYCGLKGAPPERTSGFYELYWLADRFEQYERREGASFRARVEGDL